MPIKRRHNKRREDISEEAEQWLRGKNDGLGFFLYSLTGQEFAHLWADHGDRIIEEHVDQWPGTRPYRWWQYDAPRIAVGTSRSAETPPGDAQLRRTGRERAHHDRHADALLVLDSRSLSPQICGMPLPPAYLRQKLTQPLPTKNGAVLRTIGEAANYVLAPRLIGPRALQSLAARREAPTRPSRRC